MIFVMEFVAILCTGLFAGAALYITAVEHPARMECGTLLAATEFGPSYRRAAVMQVSLAIVGAMASIANWVFTSNIVWLIGGILIVLVIPFTLIVIVPTNKKLLDASLDRNSDSARQLLIRWGTLHVVRTVLSLVAFVVFVSATIPAQWNDAAERPTGDSVLGAKEAVLRQDLFMFRSVISQYIVDKGKQPKSLDDLVQAGHLKQIPIDPMTGKLDWAVEFSDVTGQHDPGIANVHSSSQKMSSDRRAYSTW